MEPSEPLNRMIVGDGMKYEYQKCLNEEEYRDAKKLADLIDDIDNGIRIDPLEKQRLYAAKSNNPRIHYEALKILNRRWRKRR